MLTISVFGGRERRRQLPHTYANHRRKKSSTLILSLATAMIQKDCFGSIALIKEEMDGYWIKLFRSISISGLLWKFDDVARLHDKSFDEESWNLSQTETRKSTPRNECQIIMSWNESLMFNRMFSLGASLLGTHAEQIIDNVPTNDEHWWFSFLRLHFRGHSEDDSLDFLCCLSKSVGDEFWMSPIIVDPIIITNLLETFSVSYLFILTAWEDRK
jgi:hypothetical protein